MARVHMGFEFQVETSRSRKDFEDRAFSVLDELYELDGVVDPDISIDLAERQVLVSLDAEGPDPDRAVFLGSTAVRTAIHAAGGATPDWPQGVGDTLQDSPDPESWVLISAT